MGKILKYLELFKYIEKLKVEYRHSWKSDGKRESVAEHTWMMAIVAYFLFDEIDIPLNREKTIKMILIHDLVEIFAEDIPAFEKSERKNRKHENEQKALAQLLSFLPNKKLQQEVSSLWYEFEEKKTNEAKYANAMDKMEVIIQHNLTNIKSWAQGDFDVNPYYRDELFEFDSFLRRFKDQVNIDVMDKVEKAGKKKLVPKFHLKKWKASKDKKPSKAVVYP